jgi:hypothetical protein
MPTPATLLEARPPERKFFGIFLSYHTKKGNWTISSLPKKRSLLQKILTIFSN